MKDGGEVWELLSPELKQMLRGRISRFKKTIASIEAIKRESGLSFNDIHESPQKSWKSRLEPHEDVLEALTGGIVLAAISIGLQELLPGIEDELEAIDPQLLEWMKDWPESGYNDDEFVDTFHEQLDGALDRLFGKRSADITT